MNLLIRNENDEFANGNCKGVISGEKKKGKPVLLTRIWPPGLALAGRDMSKLRLFVKFRMFLIQIFVFDVISK